MVLVDSNVAYEPRVFLRGNPHRLGQPVPRRFLSLLSKSAAGFEHGSGRLELARAIVDPENPLTARVLVNRVWMHHFGEEIVRTPSDFGLRSDPPSHPELLDYLAGSFIDNGWSIKDLHRRIMTSAVGAYFAYRDKLAAARRRGKWSGGSPVLGYDLVNSKLVLNREEAERVRAIHELYLELGSLLATVRQLGRRGWRNKQWTTRKGTERGGAAFRKNSLQHLLTNVVYLGKVRHRDQVYDGEHEAIVAEELFEAVGRRLRQQRRWMPGKASRSNGALLARLVHCTPCGARMTHVRADKGARRYRYYRCGSDSNGAGERCPESSLPAARLERYMLDVLQDAGRLDEGNGASVTAAERHGQPHHSPAQRRLEFMKATATISRTIFFDSTPQVRPHPEPQHTTGLSGRVPRVARLLALAIRFEQLVADGVVENYAELARLGYVSRARLSQIANLRYLAPDIQEEILFLPAEASGRESVTERALRRRAAEPDWRVQRRMWQRAKGRASHV